MLVPIGQFGNSSRLTRQIGEANQEFQFKDIYGKRLDSFEDVHFPSFMKGIDSNKQTCTSYTFIQYNSGTIKHAMLTCVMIYDSY